MLIWVVLPCEGDEIMKGVVLLATRSLVTRVKGQAQDAGNADGNFRPKIRYRGS